MTLTLTEYVRSQPKDSTVLVVYSKEDKASGQFRNLVRYVEPPRDAGKMALLDGQNLWFYDPAAKASVRISTQQRLIGQASIGDVLTVNFAIDYSGTMLPDETITDAEKRQRNCWHLDFRAATPTAVYSRAEYWVEKRNLPPGRTRFWSDSGRVSQGPLLPRLRATARHGAPGIGGDHRCRGLHTGNHRRLRQSELPGHS